MEAEKSINKEIESLPNKQIYLQSEKKTERRTTKKNKLFNISQ